MSRKSSVFKNQKLFSPRVVRRYTAPSGILKNQNLHSLSGSVFPTAATTSSFRFDPPGSPLKSSQQLPIDFSKFENHTFFSSAKTNVNLCYEKIINNFPFDGTKDEYDAWVDDLTGFENYVLSIYPKYTGYLTFHGNNEFINIVDKAGVVFPTLSRKNSAQTILSPNSNPFFLEFDLAIPDEQSFNQYVFYHVSNTGVGYAAYLENTISTTEASLNFIVISGSDYVKTQASVPKGKFTHLSCYLDTNAANKKAYILSGTEVVGESQRFNFGSINTSGANFIIGSGSALSFGATTFTPTQTLSASVDNFRVFHKIRSKSEIERFSNRTLFPDPDSQLKLNFRFNEATGSYQNNNVVLDHSGNGLNSRITNYAAQIRNELPYESLCKFEDSVFHPTLFPSHPDVISLNEKLIQSASLYDENNPNLITKLIPQHYLDLAKADGRNGSTVYGDVFEGIEQNSNDYLMPGTAKIGQPQIISAMLFMWGRMFDELKMMIDHVSELIHVDYNKDVSIADQLLPFLTEYYGFNLPNMFRNATYDQFFDGENIVDDKTLGLYWLQNEIWRRILINLPEIIQSKGTIHSIKSLFRSAGIEPDRIFRFVEYGGGNRHRLGKSRSKITEISTMLDFSGSVVYNPSETLDAQGFYSTKPNLISSYLTGSRIEVGYPEISGSFIDLPNFPPHGISNSENDGLFTSGSWTIEGRFKFPEVRRFISPQSLIRLHVTSSTTPSHGLAMNVVINPNIGDEFADNPSVTLYCRPGFSSTDPVLQLPIENANILDGNIWYLAVGRKRNDEIDSYISSSYFLSLSRQQNGELLEYYSTSSFFLDSAQRGENVFQKKEYQGVKQNASGSFIAIGKQSIDTSVGKFLNDPTLDPIVRTTDMAGLAGHIRFWSKALSENEIKEHARNFTSLGVDNPLVNFGFSNDVTGSFEKLRLDISTDQPELTTDINGELEIVDFSQQFTSSADPGGLSFLRGFESEKQVIKPERFDFSAISYLYDEPNGSDKVRLAGLTEGRNIDEFDSLPAPIYELPKSLEPKDDVRFSIEYSVAQALSEDIMKIFSTLDALDNALGSPNMMFGDEYYSLRKLREIYFNRLTDNVNYTNFFEFFKWLDESFDVIVENLIPKKTNYLGFNMIIESHALERARVAYGSGDVYLGESDRRNLKGYIFLRQLLANIRKI